MNDIKPYPQEILDLQTTHGFIAAWFKKLHKGTSRQQAFEELDEDFIKYFGRPKFVDYKTFVSAKNQYITRQRNAARKV